VAREVNAVLPACQKKSIVVLDYCGNNIHLSGSVRLQADGF
jgi:hypothetical protein